MNRFFVQLQNDFPEDIDVENALMTAGLKGRTEGFTHEYDSMSSKTVIEKQLIIRFLADNKICLKLNRLSLFARLKIGFTVCIKITVKYFSFANNSFSLKL